MKKLALAAAGGVMCGLALTTYVGPLVADEAGKDSSVYEQLDLFGNIFERIRAQYVDEVDSQKLIEAAINGMLTSLDPHSYYLSPEDFSDMETQMSGQFQGLGIEVTQEEGYVKVISPIDGTPADKAGILAGDFITHVDGESLLGLTLNQSVDMMKGPAGSEVIITVVRDGAEAPLEISIVRDTITTRVARMRVVGDVVVVRLSTFNEQTTKMLLEELKKGIEEVGGIDQVAGVVLDLRNNAGGYLDQSITVADAFLEQGEIVSTRGRDPQSIGRSNATPGDEIQGKPMVVLINGGSASASEIVAGALQDHRRAVIVGTKSFGKGSVQSQVRLRGDGAMKLTTARYYTPSGRSIQALGVSPDIVVEQPMRAPVDPDAAKKPSTLRQRSEADLRGAISNDSMTEDERKLYEEERTRAEETAKLREEDYQLAYAVDIIKGLEVIKAENPQAK